MVIFMWATYIISVLVMIWFFYRYKVSLVFPHDFVKRKKGESMNDAWDLTSFWDRLLMVGAIFTPFLNTIFAILILGDLLDNGHGL